MTSKTLVPAGLACGAFAIWTLSVPFSGWQQIDFVNENQAAVAVIAAVVGLFFGFLADGITKALAKG